MFTWVICSTAVVCFWGAVRSLVPGRLMSSLRPDGGLIGADSRATRICSRACSGALLGVDNRGCCSRAGLVCRTSQWGAINAMYFEKTRDGQAREDAFRSLNYATYFAQSDGKIHCCGLATENLDFGSKMVTATRGVTLSGRWGRCRNLHPSDRITCCARLSSRSEGHIRKQER